MKNSSQILVLLQILYLKSSNMSEATKKKRKSQSKSKRTRQDSLPSPNRILKTLTKTSENEDKIQLVDNRESPDKTILTSCLEDEQIYPVSQVTRTAQAPNPSPKLVPGVEGSSKGKRQKRLVNEENILVDLNSSKTSENFDSSLDNGMEFCLRRFESVNLNSTQSSADIKFPLVFLENSSVEYERSCSQNYPVTDKMGQSSKSAPSCRVDETRSEKIMASKSQNKITTSENITESVFVDVDITGGSNTVDEVMLKEDVSKSNHSDTKSRGILGMGKSKRKRKLKGESGIRFSELVNEADGASQMSAGAQRKKKKRKIHTKRFVKTAGKKLWKGFRISCKFLWSGLILYTKPFGGVDVSAAATKAWMERRELQKQRRQYYTYKEPPRFNNTQQT